jgi:hypothetical protein
MLNDARSQSIFFAANASSALEGYRYNIEGIKYSGNTDVILNYAS